MRNLLNALCVLCLVGCEQLPATAGKKPDVSPAAVGNQKTQGAIQSTRTKITGTRKSLGASRKTHKEADVILKSVDDDLSELLK